MASETIAPSVRNACAAEMKAPTLHHVFDHRDSPSRHLGARDTPMGAPRLLPDDCQRPPVAQGNRCCEWNPTKLDPGEHLDV
jgi:hypothetical protein